MTTATATEKAERWVTVTRAAQEAKVSRAKLQTLGLAGMVKTRLVGLQVQFEMGSVLETLRQDPE